MADVAVLPSLWDEPFGLTCVEALAAGLPLITTKRGGIPEIADDSCAILLDCNNFLAQKIADAIIMLYNDPEKRLRMSKASLIRSKSFNQDIYAQNIFQVLSNI
jgi:glycosyltransferase involved in cell wall biosynthesis